MSKSFDLRDLQASIIGIPNDLVLPESHYDLKRENRLQSIKKIVDIYCVSRKNNRVFASTYNSLQDPNPFVRAAAADVIGSIGNKNSFDHLFKALEDEEHIHVRQQIVAAIDSLELKVSKNPKQKVDDNVSIMKTARILTYNP